MTNYSNIDQTPEPRPPALPLPLHKPFFTYVLIVAIVLIWLAMEIVDSSQNSEVLLKFGANVGVLILQGQTWRLFTSMFLHIGLMHLLFNSYALFIFGVEMERLYGPDRFIIIYILSGLFGSLASFAMRGPLVFSAGASGAIFGIIGMNLAFFMLHRETFGHFGRQRMMNTVVIIVINVIFGFTMPNIDNYAHLGGLIAGFAMGYGLAPRYDVVDRYTLSSRVVDTVSLLKRWWVPTLAIVLLSGGVSLAITYWLGILR
ncbi:MAG: rhomboid family intramembrane serine protease [Anaerolineae bacterium]|nr:rhomboid family intramembrane serine protease [Anaerolineae bacterium]